MTKRPLVIITVSYIISILWGIYLKKYIPFLFLIVLIIDLILGSKIFKIKRKMMKQKIEISNINLYIFCTILIIVSSIFISHKDNSFYNFKVKDNVVNAIVAIDEVNQDSDYYYNYVVKVVKYNNNDNNKKVKLYLKIPKKFVKTKLKYGDLICIKGEFEKGEVRRNYRGFSYFDYLKSKNIYGTIKAENVDFLREKYTNAYNMWINSLRERIGNNIKKLIPKENSGIAIALLIGDSTEIEENQKQTFSDANLSHILAISGMHVSYVILRPWYFIKENW